MVHSRLNNSYELLVWLGYSKDNARNIAQEFNKVKELTMNKVNVRLFMKDGNFKDYQLERIEYASKYIANAVDKSIKEDRDDAHFVVGGRIL